MLSLLDRLKIHIGKYHGLKMASLWKVSLAGQMPLEEKGPVFLMCMSICAQRGEELYPGIVY